MQLGLTEFSRVEIKVTAKKHFIGIKLTEPLRERLGRAVQIEDTDRSKFIRKAVRDRAERILKKQGVPAISRKIYPSSIAGADGAPLSTST